MDSDCLIKLTKAKAKDNVVKCVAVSIPEIVKKETVDEGKTSGYADPLEIERNIKAGKIEVKSVPITQEVRSVAETLRLRGGETDAYGLFRKGGFVAIASDDQKFIRKMEEMEIPCITPTALIIYAWKKNAISKGRALKLLEYIKPMVSDEEYVLSKLEIEKGGGFG